MKLHLLYARLKAPAPIGIETVELGVFTNRTKAVQECSQLESEMVKGCKYGKITFHVHPVYLNPKHAHTMMLMNQWL